MSDLAPYLSNPLYHGTYYSYDEITRVASEHIARILADAFRNPGVDGLLRRECAYGMYLGWRTLLMSHVDQAKFSADDKRLERLFHPVVR